MVAKKRADPRYLIKNSKMLCSAYKELYDDFMKDLRWISHFQTIYPASELSAEQQTVLQQISHNFMSDFSGGTSGHFSHENAELIIRRSSELMKEKIISLGELSEAALRDSWRQVVMDYHQNQHWGVKTQLTGPAPARPLTVSQISQRELFSYVWMLIQAAIIMKCVVYYFGLKASTERTPESRYYLFAVLAFSTASLFYFAWRKFKQEDP